MICGLTRRREARKKTGKRAPVLPHARQCHAPTAEKKGGKFLWPHAKARSAKRQGRGRPCLGRCAAKSAAGWESGFCGLTRRREARRRREEGGVSCLARQFTPPGGRRGKFWALTRRREGGRDREGRILVGSAREFGAKAREERQGKEAACLAAAGKSPPGGEGGKFGPHAKPKARRRQGRGCFCGVMGWDGTGAVAIACGCCQIRGHPKTIFAYRKRAFRLSLAIK